MCGSKGEDRSSAFVCSFVRCSFLSIAGPSRPISEAVMKIAFLRFTTGRMDILAEWISAHPFARPPHTTTTYNDRLE